MAKTPKVVRQIRISEKLWDEAKKTAERNDETISEVIRRAVENYVRRHR